MLIQAAMATRMMAITAPMTSARRRAGCGSSPKMRTGASPVTCVS
jgi:hypothetical protein